MVAAPGSVIFYFWLKSAPVARACNAETHEMTKNLFFAPQNPRVAGVMPGKWWRGGKVGGGGGVVG